MPPPRRSAGVAGRGSTFSVRYGCAWALALVAAAATAGALLSGLASLDVASLSKRFQPQLPALPPELSGQEGGGEGGGEEEEGGTPTEEQRDWQEAPPEEEKEPQGEPTQAMTAAPTPPAKAAEPAPAPAPAATQPPPPTTPKPKPTTKEKAQKPTEGPSIARLDAVRQQALVKVVRKRAGLYLRKGTYPEFANVVLVTAANTAYWQFYENWACAARSLRLDWAVVANDDEVLKRLGEDRGLPVAGHKVSNMVGWGNIHLDYVGQNKMSTVLEIMALTGLAVVFTDADNVFIRDPFAPGPTLGDLIRAKKYDYVFQTELEQHPPQDYKPPGDGGNTGFFYASPSRSSANMQGFFRTVVAEISVRLKHGGAADQPIWWELFNELRHTGGKKCGSFPGCGGFKCARMCGWPASGCAGSGEEVLEFCPMEPMSHPTGWKDALPYRNSMFTFHANYAANERKIEKLEKMGLWNLCKSPEAAGAEAEGQDEADEPDGPQPTDEKRQKEFQDDIIQVAQRRAGLYANKELFPEFAKVILVTAANTAYWSFYENWACAAEQLGLDWAVVANDDEVYKRLGADRALPVQGVKVNEMVGWGNIRLDFVGRNKMATVLEILRTARLEVVFTDADNVFIKDPFQPGVSLGDLIRQQRYQYVYQPELQHRPDPGYKSPGDGGNTGFFYASARRKPALIGLFDAVRWEIDVRLKKGGAADQPIWWEVFNELSHTKGAKCGSTACGGFTCVRMCGNEASACASTNDDEVLDYCDMDPLQHPTGWEDAIDYRASLATYHANYVTGDEKVAKLKKMRLWDQCKERKAGGGAVAKGAKGKEDQKGKGGGDPAAKAYEEQVSAVARRRAGLYADKSLHPEFATVLLVTAANSAYWAFYANWACAAAKLGLDWAAIGNDDESLSKLGPDKGLPVLGHKVKEMVGWGDKRLDYVGRNKMSTVLEIMRLTGLDVVFSDADNVFIRDPFGQGGSLGDLIGSRIYDYIYQPELQSRPAPDYRSPGDGGNTGFFYASARKSPRMLGLFSAVVAEIDLRIQRGGAADQPIWWELFNQLRSTSGAKCGNFPCGGFKCVRMCGQEPSCQAPDNEMLEYCGMDPFRHPTGWEDAVQWRYNLYTYHANYAANELKIEKLKKIQLWDLCEGQ